MFIVVLAAAASGWVVEDKKSQLDGAVSYSATLTADSDVTNIGDRPEKPYLGFICDKGGLYVTIGWPDFVRKQYSDDLKVPVRWKLDAAPVQSTKMIATSQAVALPGKAGQAWFHQLAAGHKLVVSVPDEHGGQEATFTLDGIAPLDSRLQTISCGR